MSHTINIFSGVMIIMLFLAIFIPIFNTAIGETQTTDYTTVFEQDVLSSTHLTIFLNIGTIAFWTFGLNSWINLLILLPLRVIGLISLWFIISPAK